MTLIISSADRLWIDAIATTGAPIASVFDTAQIFNGFGRQNPGALGDTVEFNFSLKPGDYNLVLFGRTGDTEGIHDVLINNVLINTIDRYTAAKQYNRPFVMTVTITTNSNIFKSVVIGKNPSSTGFDVALSHIFLAPA